MGSVDRNIKQNVDLIAPIYVAPRMGSVDRNCCYAPARLKPWIVAPRMGSVDRNFMLALPAPAAVSRSPHGERG